MKNENNAITEFVRLRAKMYALRDCKKDAKKGHQEQRCSEILNI